MDRQVLMCQQQQPACSGREYGKDYGNVRECGAIMESVLKKKKTKVTVGRICGTVRECGCVFGPSKDSRMDRVETAVRLLAH